MTVIEAKERFRSPLVLPEQFWNSRSTLEQIRDAARKRQAPPDMVLGAVLAQIAVLADPRLRIMGGYPSPLGLFVCMVTDSSGGKTTSMQVAEELLPHLPGHALINPAVPGSGERLLDLFWSEVPTQDGKRTERVRSKSSVLVTVDEASLLDELARRGGNSFASFLLTAFTGTSLGTEAISSGDRRLEAGSYVLSLVMGIQPDMATQLMERKASGFVQRFLWFTRFDPGAPATQPDDLDFDPLPLPQTAIGRQRLTARGLVRLDRSDAIGQQLWTAGWQRKQIDHVSDGFGHDLLIQLRVAHVLALLDGRLDATDEDWALASMVLATSTAVRSWVLDGLRRNEERRKAALIHFEMAKELALAQQREERLLQSTCRRVFEVVVEHQPVDVFHKKQFSPQQRPFIDSAVAKHAEMGNIVRSADGWRMFQV